MNQNTLILIVLFLLLDFFEQISGADHCPNGHVCPSPQKCCKTTCCLPDGYEHHYKTFRWSVWNMWYFWFVMIFVLMSCFGGCGYWRRRQLLLAQQHHAMLHTSGYNDLFNRRLRSLRHAAAANAAQRHQSQRHIPVSVYAGFDTAFAPMPTSFSRNLTPSNGGGGPPEGIFPQPPPYSEVAKDGEISSYPPQYKEDQLPPYSPNPYLNINQHIGPNEREIPCMGDQVPGLPPYSLSVIQNAPAMFSANHQPSVDDTIANRNAAHSNQFPSNDASANQNASYSISSPNPELPTIHYRSTPQLNTSPPHNLDSDNPSDDRSGNLEGRNETIRSIYL